MVIKHIMEICLFLQENLLVYAHMQNLFWNSDVHLRALRQIAECCCLILSHSTFASFFLFILNPEWTYLYSVATLCYFSDSFLLPVKKIIIFSLLGGNNNNSFSSFSLQGLKHSLFISIAPCSKLNSGSSRMWWSTHLQYV